MPSRADISRILKTMEEVARMKLALVTACCLLAAAFAAAESVEVTPVVPKESSGHVRISVVLNGKPVKSAKVDFRTARGEQICFSVMTGDNGVAAPKVLPPGNYQVTATTEDELNTDLYLHVSHKSKATVFSMDLTPSYQAAQAAIEAANKLPIRERVRQFQGCLEDPSGAVVPGVDIRLFRKGSDDKKDFMRLKSDTNGRFSAQLADGLYVAFFSMPGFRTEIIPFEVSVQGKDEIVLKLQVGQSTESLQVSTER